MPERRKTDRRTNPAVPEPIERKRERRGEERRDSLRKKATFVVSDGQRTWEVAGEVGLGGASFVLPKSAVSDALVVELRVGRAVLRLAGAVADERAPRELVHPVHLKFGELDTATELALAKWLDDVEDA